MVHKLTVCPEEVIEQLEEGEAVPALRGLDLQSGIHVDGIKGQEVFCMLHHEVCPPRKRLETQHEGKQNGEQVLRFRDEVTQRRKTREEGGNNAHNFSSSDLKKEMPLICKCSVKE